MLAPGQARNLTQQSRSMLLRLTLVAITIPRQVHVARRGHELLVAGELHAHTVSGRTYFEPCSPFPTEKHTQAQRSF